MKKQPPGRNRATQAMTYVSLVFGGTKNIDNAIKLPYELNALKFAYSALFYENHDKTQYSYYLEGFDSPAGGWSEWSQKTEKEYTNLHAGKYIFKVII